MLLFAPDWVVHGTGKHKKTPIYSVHIHPDGSKLATAGLANIKIWSMDAIKSQQVEQDQTSHKLLATLSVHNGAILCVRWSPTGTYLASGSEDSKVVIWKEDASGLRNSSFGETTNKSVLSYRALKFLSGHESDVADLSWSLDGVFLASCGFDRRVNVWDGSSFELVKRIDVHSGFVKGVTWDPVGKYLATQSDDRSIKIFRVSDWQVEKSVTDPLQTGASSSFFTRLSWGPDGATIVATNGESGSVCVAPIVERQDWKSQSFLVGHKAAVEVSCFSPKLFKPTASSNGVNEYYCVCATGSQDNAISIWQTSKPRPLTNIADAVVHSVLDLSWSSDGCSLVGCSYDGTVVYMSFDERELGFPLTDDETDRVLSKFGRKGVAHMVPESIAQLELESQRVTAQTANRLDALMHGSALDFNDAIAKRKVHPTDLQLSQTQLATPPKKKLHMPQVQNVTITKDGKKRIKPILLQNNLDDDLPTQNPVFQSTPNPNVPHTPTVNSAIHGLQPHVIQHLAEQVTYILPTVKSDGDLPKLSIPKPRSVLVGNLSAPDSSSALTVESRNTLQASKVTCNSGDEQLWVYKLASPIILMELSVRFVACACVDATLHILSCAGRRLFPVILLNAPVSFMSALDHRLLVIDGVGDLSLWDIPLSQCIISSISVIPLLRKSETDTAKSVTIAGVKLNETGSILLFTSNGHRYTYHEGMKTWMKLAQTDSISNQLSSSAERLQLRRFPNIDKLEELLASASATESSNDFKHFFRQYARKLVDESAVSKAREICQELLGDYQAPASGKWNPTIAGLSKHELLKEVLPILSENRSFQRFIVATQEALKFQMEE